MSVPRILEAIRDRHAGGVDRELWSHADAVEALAIWYASERVMPDPGGWWHRLVPDPDPDPTLVEEAVAQALERQGLGEASITKLVPTVVAAVRDFDARDVVPMTPAGEYRAALQGLLEAWPDSHLPPGDNPTRQALERARRALEAGL